MTAHITRVAAYAIAYVGCVSSILLIWMLGSATVLHSWSLAGGMIAGILAALVMPNLHRRAAYHWNQSRELSDGVIEQ